MNRLLRPSLLAGAAALVAGVAVPTKAHAGVEVGGTAGIHVFSDKNELGVADTPSAESLRNSALFGLRLGVFFGSVIGVEGEIGLIPSEPRDAVFDVWSLVYRAHVVAQFRAGNPENKLIPFVLFGGGAMQVVDSKMDTTLDEDTDGTLHFGVGAKYRVDNGWGLRLDGRILFPPASVDGDGDPSSGFTQDFEVLLSIYKEFGRKKVEKVIEAPPPDPDPDKDGILADADRCPNDPEDKDSYQDDDGCPDNDNDGDGIADAADRCPLEAEDLDGFQDDDGCPDTDNDADSILDASDRCPMEAEDKDGFQDDDGCPDADNDADGVPDAQDKCPDQPETQNGFQDSDGCPDEIPEQLKKFTGVIQGINFRTNSADLLATSNRQLDKAVAVLKEFPELRVEIQGHTDDQAIKKSKKNKFQTNLELSQARAESVTAYLVKKGIEQGRLVAKGYADSVPVAPIDGLKGGKLTAARAKNRRTEFKLISSAATPTPAPAPATP